MKVLGDNKDAVESMSAAKLDGVPGAGEGVYAPAVHDDARGGDALCDKVVSHDGGLVVALPAGAAAGDNGGKVTIAIELDGPVEARAQSGGRCAVGIDPAAKDQSSIGLAEVVAQTRDDDNGGAENE
jgi:hypothetical protein